MAAPQTFVDVRLVSGPRLQRKVGIRDKAARHIDDIRFSAGNDLFHHSRVGKRSYRGDLAVLNMRFDCGGILYIHPVF